MSNAIVTKGLTKYYDNRCVVKLVRADCSVSRQQDGSHVLVFRSRRPARWLRLFRGLRQCSKSAGSIHRQEWLYQHEAQS